MLVGYARVSRTDQNTKLQIDALNEAGVEKVFQEKASGAQRNRPQLKAALDYMRKGDTLVVWKIDRLARSLKQLIDTVEMLKERGIHFKCLTQDIDTGTANGRFFFQIFAALSEFEREMIRERTMAGLEAARKKGNHPGRPPALSEDTLAQAKAMLASGDIPVRKIAKTLGIATSTLYRHFEGGRGSLV